MRSRTDILAVFSTFIQFAGDRFDTWVCDPKLAQSMQRSLLSASEPNHSEQFWALHWYQLRDRHPLAQAHLWAYLQDPCYLAADQVTRRFTRVHCSLADGFQLAIANVDRILDRYDPNYGSTLKVYARTAFGNCIRDQLRQQQEVNISSDWGLLRRLSQTQLTQALLTAGFIHVEMPILIWQCFKAVCIPEPGRPSRSLTTPSEAQLTAIAERSRQQVQQSEDGAMRDLANRPMEPKQLMVELIQLATIARSYLTPTITSLNQPQYDDSGEEQLDALSDEDTPMAQLLAAETYTEHQRYMQQIGGVLEAAIAALDMANQSLLQLYYQEALTQTEIANHLNIQQYQVSRKLSRIRQRLLLDVANWSTQVLHTPTDSDVLASVSEVIHEWLQCHYAPPSEGPEGAE